MKQVLIASPNDKSLLAKALMDKVYPKPVLIRMGDESGRPYLSYPIQINNANSVLLAQDKVRVKDVMHNYGLHCCPTRSHLEDVGYPCILKGRCKNEGRDSVFYVENSNDFKVAKAMVGKYGYFLEPFYKTTSEYKLFCTQKEVFCSLKKLKTFSEDIICNRRNSVYLLMTKEKNIVFPKLWKSIQNESLALMKTLKLDIAAIDIGYCSDGDHSFRIFKVNTNPYLTGNVVNIFAQQIDNLIKEKK